MNWLQKISQEQLMFNFPDLAYYQTFGPTYSPRKECYFCHRELTPQDIEEDISIYPDVAETTKLKFNVPPEMISTMIEQYFTEANAAIKQYAYRPDLGMEVWDVPLTKDQKGAISDELSKILWGAMSSLPYSLDYGSQHMAFRRIFDCLRIWNFNTMGELDSQFDASRSKIPNVIQLFKREYDSLSQTKQVSICLECASERMEQCKNCGTWVDVEDDETTWLENGRDKDGNIIGDYYCPECSEDAGTCESCSKRYKKDDIRYIPSSDTYEGYEYTLCESCFENTDWSTCEKCEKYITSNNHIRIRGDVCLCPDCYSDAGTLLDIDHYNDVLEKLGLDQTGSIPLQTTKVQKFFIPFFQQYLKKFGNPAMGGRVDANRVLQYAQKTNIKDVETLKTIEFLCQTSADIPNIITYLEGVIKFNEEFKQKYPNLKHVSNIPARFQAADSYGDPDVNHMTIEMKPDSDLIDFAKHITPRGKEMWNKLNIGHHDGCIAYARIGQDIDDEDIWIINNIQSDADIQKLGPQIRHSYQTIWDQLQSDPASVDINDETVQDAMAAAFWNKTLRHWQPLILDVVIQLAKASQKTLYITPMAMQRKKWGNIPERSEDAYEKVPLQMGGEPEREYVKPESLVEGRYDLIRLANWLQKVSAVELDYQKLGQLWQMSPEVAKAGAMWLVIAGYDYNSIQQMSRQDILRCCFV